jgi:transcription termination/antitermination protein NusA
MTVLLETDTIKMVALFENVTNVHARDCIITDRCVYFLVDPKNVGAAIGKSGSITKNLSRNLGKGVKVFGYADKPDELIRNIIPNIKSIEINDDTMMVSVPPEDKTRIIGSGGRNIRFIKEVLNRHFGIKNFRLR